MLPQYLPLDIHDARKLKTFFEDINLIKLIKYYQSVFECKASRPANSSALTESLKMDLPW